MEQSAITDYIFPQRKLELIWLVTHMPGCQLQHTIPDTTPRWAQLAAALPTHCCGPHCPPVRGGGWGSRVPTGWRAVCDTSESAGHRHVCPYRSMCVYITPGREAHKCPPTHIHICACARAHTHTHTHTHTLGMPQ